jgi:hypothetical protein
MIIVEQILGSHIGKSFKIRDIGTSQTAPNNTGRVGFHVESLFGITPNNSRNPDLGDKELKTIALKGANLRPSDVSIGTMPVAEYDRLQRRGSHSFLNSDPFAKMKNTLAVFYEKCSGYGDQTVYQLHGWADFDFTKLPDSELNILQTDYDICVAAIQRHSYDALSGSGLCIPHCEYLKLTYKGNGAYNYPAWKFTSRMIQALRAQ